MIHVCYVIINSIHWEFAQHLCLYYVKSIPGNKGIPSIPSEHCFSNSPQFSMLQNHKLMLQFAFVFSSMLSRSIFYAV